MEAMQRWTCVEAGCDYAAYGTDEDAVVTAAMDHIRSAHGSFELEEMILTALEPAPGGPPADWAAVGGVRVAPAWAARHDPELAPETRKSMEWSPTRGLADL